MMLKYVIRHCSAEGPDSEHWREALLSLQNLDQLENGLVYFGEACKSQEPSYPCQ